ncbi:hypothetical protein FACS189459_5820 [Bacilli bacterium]|nr:hypothetical protein FACS189459_5820 [Bacilli bacterium]
MPHILQFKYSNEVNFDISKSLILALKEQFNLVKELGRFDPKLAELKPQLLQLNLVNEVNFDISKSLILALEEQFK